MLKELLLKQREYINYFFEHLDLKIVEKLFKLFMECQGVIFFTGVGKSGLVAEKIAVTMTSTGSRAIFISPINAMHGDIGILTDKDLMVMVSKSGESEELLHLIPAIRNKHAKIISIVSDPKSRLALSSDFNIILPLKRELCPYNMVPTTSTTIQGILGDALAVALMLAKNFTIDDYAINHPAGRIGRRITVRVSDLMLRNSAIPLCKPTDKLVDTLVELSNKRCGCVLVVDANQKLLGIFTDGDLRRGLLNKGSNALEETIENLMTRNPRMIAPDRLAVEAMEIMEADQKNAITVLPVVEEDHVVGLIKLHDIVQSGI